MATHAKGFVVTFEHNIHDEDVERVVELLNMIKGVVSVDPVPDKGLDDHINRERVKHELIAQILETIRTK